MAILVAAAVDVCYISRPKVGQISPVEGYRTSSRGGASSSTREGGDFFKGGEVAFPFKGALETYTTPADKKWLLHSLFTLRGLLLVLSHAECA